MRKALRYILILVIVGILIIGGGLGALYFVPNTFAQDDGTQVVVIEKGQTGTEIADMLFERGLIRSTQGFKLWLYLSGTNDKLQTGHYQIPNKVTVRELISLLQEGHVESIRVTIPEGYTVGDIAIVLEKNQIMKAKDFLAEAKTYVPYPYMKGTKPATYPVEGFLFPSTYEIPVGATPRDVIQMMADEMNRYLTPAVKKQIQAQHMSIHDFVTLASIVERESLFDADRPTIAGVFKKRLAHGIPLQSDATISYVLGYAKENVTIGDTQLQSPYNTYVSKGLPPGPIANPGKKALDAVLHSENTDYLYFVADKEGHNHFSKSYEEHLAAVNKIYGADTVKNSSANTEVAAQAGPNYDVAVATTEPNYNYSSAEAVEADSQYVDVEPSYKYTPTTVPAAEIADPVPGSTQNQSSTQVTPAAPSYGNNTNNNTYVPTTTPVPESMQNVIPNAQQVPQIQVEPANPAERSTLVVPSGTNNR
ncbi:endolytic transglycosylase MltG [Veillonella parvula]|uniref:endolytic transglycosylase MltG n=1 Tax=Veillonella parvula TaxID=29466 RepID=UPI00290F2958|nr:endolytic transglycosylase MltG [Veillonella parvula]MDU5166569.1 endolytic transglycosylase MltG [Veillonella parvula]MDU5557579.1 endolytic transglycosylase MltG [Veillonella parvula]MDU7279141.1 endolytic transglycosylase MltG [Veillonella parvula]